MNKKIDKLAATLEERKGATIVKLEAIVDARLNKTGVLRYAKKSDYLKDKWITVERKIENPFGNVRKRVITKTMLGCKYEKAVKRQGEREDNPKAKMFRAGERQWGNKINDSLVEYYGKEYLRTQTTAGFRKANPAKVEYIAEDGKILSYDDVAPFLPEKPKPYQAGNEDKIDERDYALENLISLTMGGKKIEL